jgi:hypothetical protein
MVTNSKEYNRKYYQSNKEKWLKNLKENVKKFRESHPDYWKGCYQKYGKKSYLKHKDNSRKVYRTPIKIKAWNNANKKVIIPSGKLCEFCNSSLADVKHHFNYNKPLDVTFLCKKCHRELHAKLKEKK